MFGTMGAFLFEQGDFPGRQAYYFLALTPLVIPGVILGISLLLTANNLGIYFEDAFGVDKTAGHLLYHLAFAAIGHTGHDKPAAQPAPAALLILSRKESVQASFRR